nr:KUP/HAK/KT family potassium transporter [Frankia sp. AgKG'84/4]
MGRPSAALTPLPLVLLATAATVIASQAVITGAYPVAAQAAELGHLPRLRRPRDCPVIMGSHIDLQWATTSRDHRAPRPCGCFAEPGAPECQTPGTMRRSRTAPPARAARACW